MKRLFLSSIIMLMAIAANAQVKVAPKLAKGQKMVYTTVTTTSMGMNIKTTADVAYEVTDETADGFVITVNNTKFEAEGGDETMRTIMTLAEQMLLNQPIELTTDREGKLTGIRNIEKVKQNATALAAKLIDDVFVKYPAIAQVMSKEMLMSQVTQSLDEEALLQSIAKSPITPLSLNGLTIRNMSQDTYQNTQGINMKRMFFVTNGGKTITTNATANMTESEVKEFIIQQVEEKAPEQAEMIKQNIDAMMANGMMKIEATEKAKYDLGENGWVTAIEYSSTMEMMGQGIKIETHATLK